MEKYNLKLDTGGLIVTYNGLDERGEEYLHPLYGDNTVWYCEDWNEVYEEFLKMEQEHGLDYVLRYELDGVLSDLGLPIPA